MLDKFNIMIENLDNDKDESFESIKWLGMKMGFVFFCLSLLMGVTMIIPIGIASILESVSSILASFTNSNTGITAFYVSVVGLLLPAFFYVKGILTKSPSSSISLLILFLCLIIFSNTALFYKDWLQPNFRMDGQQGFGLVILPFKTSWIYLVIGYVHDIIKESKR